MLLWIASAALYALALSGSVIIASITMGESIIWTPLYSLYYDCAYPVIDFTATRYYVFDLDLHLDLQYRHVRILFYPSSRVTLLLALDNQTFLPGPVTSIGLRGIHYGWPCYCYDARIRLLCSNRYDRRIIKASRMHPYVSSEHDDGHRQD